MESRNGRVVNYVSIGLAGGKCIRGGVQITWPKTECCSKKSDRNIVFRLNRIFVEKFKRTPRPRLLTRFN